MTLQQALNKPDCEKFIEAMEAKVESHVKRNHWKIVTCQQMCQLGYKENVIMAVWSMKQKRNPLGKVIKHKVRLCAHGGQTKQGVHYDTTYSPVVAWSTIHLMLILSIIHGWHTHQINFVLAFPQADIKIDVYMEVPRQFKVLDGKLVRDNSAPNPCT